MPSIKSEKGTYNKGISVPESYIKKIRGKRTMDAAIKAFGGSSDPKMQEALRRFYGAKTVASKVKSLGVASATKAPKPYPMKSYVETGNTRKPGYAANKRSGGTSGDGSGKPMSVRKPNKNNNAGKAVATVGAGAAGVGFAGVVKNIGKIKSAGKLFSGAPSTISNMQGLKPAKKTATKAAATPAKKTTAKKTTKTSAPKKTAKTSATKTTKTTSAKTQSAATRSGTQNKIKSQGGKMTRSSATDRQPRRK